jgi:hydroxyethylthiazole kinase
MTDSIIDLTTANQALNLVRQRRPLVHNITNYVAMSVSANVLLALGASPAMVHAVEEASDFSAIASSLVINIGTLSPIWVDGMRAAARMANSLKKPWVLDPVGCGATLYRTEIAAELAGLHPAIIRGNASEILSLAAAKAERDRRAAARAEQAQAPGQDSAAMGGKGVDSTASSDDAVAAAIALAKRTGAVVAVTGATDYATDGTRLVAVDGGDPLMTLSTALGCALSACVAAFAAIAPPLSAAASALAVYAAAGSIAAARCRGPGSLPAELCDALYHLDSGALASHASISVRAL